MWSFEEKRNIEVPSRCNTCWRTSSPIVFASILFGELYSYYFDIIAPTTHLTGKPKAKDVTPHNKTLTGGYYEWKTVVPKVTLLWVALRLRIWELPCSTLDRGTAILSNFLYLSSVTDEHVRFGQTHMTPFHDLVGILLWLSLGYHYLRWFCFGDFWRVEVAQPTTASSSILSDWIITPL
jgi:hypothetical protein